MFGPRSSLEPFPHPKGRGEGRVAQSPEEENSEATCEAAVHFGGGMKPRTGKEPEG